MLKASVGPHRRHRQNPWCVCNEDSFKELSKYNCRGTWIKYWLFGRGSDTKPDAGRVFVRCNLSATSVNVASWIEIALTWITMIESRVRQFSGGSADVVLRYSGGVLTGRHMIEAATSGKEWPTLVVDSEKTKQITLIP